MSEGGRFDPRVLIIIDRLKETLETRQKVWRLIVDDISTTHTYERTREKALQVPISRDAKCKQRLDSDLVSAMAHMD